MIQISPHVESSPVSGPEKSLPGGAVKKEGLGVFAKILAGLLRKAGEKDGPSAGDRAAEAKKLKPDTKRAEVSGAEALASLFPGSGAVRGKKSAGLSGPENAVPVPLPAEKKFLTAGDFSNRKTGRDEAEGGRRLAAVSRKPPEGEAGAGEKAGIPMDLAPFPGEAVPAEGEDFRPLESLNFGDLSGAGPDAAEGQEGPGRPEKAEAGPVYADSPEEIFSTRPEGPHPGLFPGESRRGDTGEKGEPRSRLAEGRQKEKRRDKISLEVRDFRTGEERNSGIPGVQNSQSPDSRPLAGRGETEILVELRGGNPGREAPRTADQTWESRAGRSFEDFLARELHQNLNGDIVRHASVVLRDGGEGTIRLALRPESLGNVKIRLEMADNKVTGHIVVESEAALRAFERELVSLEQSFRDSGFDGADLDMSLGGEMNREWTGDEGSRPSMPERLAALRYDAVPEGLEPSAGAGELPAGVFTRNGRIAVNMLV